MKRPLNQLVRVSGWLLYVVLPLSMMVAIPMLLLVAHRREFEPPHVVEAWAEPLVAVGTLVLAASTFLMAASTRREARVTAEMAEYSARQLKLQSESLHYEVLPYVVSDGWEVWRRADVSAGATDASGWLDAGLDSIAATIRNVGRGAATIVDVRLRFGGRDYRAYISPSSAAGFQLDERGEPIHHTTRGGTPMGVRQLLPAAVLDGTMPNSQCFFRLPRDAEPGDAELTVRYRSIYNRGYKTVATGIFDTGSNRFTVRNEVWPHSETDGESLLLEQTAEIV